MTDQYDDLQQIFGYQGAIDERTGVRDLAPADGSALGSAVGSEPERSTRSEVLVVPFWTPRFCATVIRAAEAVGAFEPQPDDPVPGHEVSLAVISPRLFEHVEIDLGVRIWPQLQTVWPYIDYHGLRDMFVIRYAMGEQEHLRMHHDIAQVSASAKLNDGYDGAVLDFPRQGVDNASTTVGELVVWPSLVTHPHQATPLRSGVKYGLTVWFELPSF